MRRLSFLLLATLSPAASAQSAKTAFGGTIPPSCEGGHIDLAQLSACRCALSYPPVIVNGQQAIVAGSSCGSAIEQTKIAPLVNLSVAVTPAVIHGGDPITFVVTIKNQTNAPVPVVMRHQPAFWHDTDLKLIDWNGHDVAHDGPCGSGVGGAGGNYMIVLAPLGVAEWRVPYRAVTMVSDANCAISQRPLRPGSYTVQISLPLMQMNSPVAVGSLRVQ